MGRRHVYIVRGESARRRLFLQRRVWGPRYFNFSNVFACGIQTCACWIRSISSNTSSLRARMSHDLQTSDRWQVGEWCSHPRCGQSTMDLELLKFGRVLCGDVGRCAARDAFLARDRNVSVCTVRMASESALGRRAQREYQLPSARGLPTSPGKRCQRSRHWSRDGRGSARRADGRHQREGYRDGVSACDRCA